MTSRLSRREFLQHAGALTAAGLLGCSVPLARPASAAHLPRWRGFNLLEMFAAGSPCAPFRESDFEWMAEWGFDFVRLPMSYRCWSEPESWRVMNDSVLREVDRAVALGRKYGIHVSLNFHRAPGYSVSRAREEPFNLWADDEALEACAYQWAHFARRYRDVPGSDLSFDLVNEPGLKSYAGNELLDGPSYLRIMRVLVDAIRAESPERLIIACGLGWGRVPVPELAALGVAQSTRGYDPMLLSHWKADWVEGAGAWPEPTWPLPSQPHGAVGFGDWLATVQRDFPTNAILRDLAPAGGEAGWNRARIDQQLIRPWKQLERMGVGVHVGEFGAFRHTPHEVALAWLADLLDAWSQAGWGWALWNFRGPFGILDSERRDVKYENFRGHLLDRSLLELLRQR